MNEMYSLSFKERLKDIKISVIIPIYKAEKFIKKHLEIMKESVSKTFPNYEIIAVIDGIVDNSKKEAEKVEGILLLSYKENMGKGHALSYGFKHSTGDYITFIDCDMDIHPDQLRNLIPYMITADLVIGNKRHPFSKIKYPFFRKVLSYGFILYSWVLLGIRLKDTQSGLKLIKREVLDVIMPLLIVKRYAFDLELCFIAQKHGFRIVEAPYYLSFQKFYGKNTTIRIKDIFGMFVEVLSIKYNYSIKKSYQKAFWLNMGWIDSENDKEDSA